MNDQKAIINQIISSAKEKSEEIINNANIEAEDIIKKAKYDANEYVQSNFPNKDAYIGDLVYKAKIVSELDARKILLQKKRSLINEIFDRIAYLIKQPDFKDSYKKIITKIIKDNAEDGDTVIFSKDDSKIFTSDFVTSISKEMKIKLNYSRDYGDFKGGVILYNDKYDKNITLESELEALRVEHESRIAEILFGTSRSK